jgi:hypothetical protein
MLWPVRNIVNSQVGGFYADLLNVYHVQFGKARDS